MSRIIPRIAIYVTSIGMMGTGGYFVKDAISRMSRYHAAEKKPAVIKVKEISREVDRLLKEINHSFTARELIDNRVQVENLNRMELLKLNEYHLSKAKEDSDFKQWEYLSTSNYQRNSAFELVGAMILAGAGLCGLLAPGFSPKRPRAPTHSQQTA